MTNFVSKIIIYIFNSETATIDPLAEDFDEWAEKILNDYDYLLGYKLAKKWQEENGQLEVGKRLLPKTPFFANGEFATENLYACDSVKGVRFRGDID